MKNTLGNIAASTVALGTLGFFTGASLASEDYEQRCQLDRYFGKPCQFKADEFMALSIAGAILGGTLGFTLSTLLSIHDYLSDRSFSEKIGCSLEF